MADGPSTSFADEGAGGDDELVVMTANFQMSLRYFDDRDPTSGVIREENNRFVRSHAE